MQEFLLFKSFFGVFVPSHKMMPGVSDLTYYLRLKKMIIFVEPRDEKVWSWRVAGLYDVDNNIVRKTNESPLDFIMHADTLLDSSLHYIRSGIR